MKNRFTLKNPSTFADIDIEKQDTVIENPKKDPLAVEQPSKEDRAELVKKQKILSLIKKYRETHQRKTT